MTPASRPPLVSVIVIFLNAERFIDEAIDSVLRQTYAHWELLLVDDGSTDASTGIAKRYAEADPGRVRYLEHPGHINRGMSASRNLGIREAAGELVAFLDSDDVWMPEKLQQQVAIMLANPEIGMVCGAANYWTSWSDMGGGQPDRVVPTGGPQDQVSYPPSLLLLLYPLGKGVSPCPSDLMLRREILLQVRGFEEQFVGLYHLYEDQAFLAKVYLVSPVYISSAMWLLYRQHSDSCVASVKREGKHHAVRRYFLVWLARYLADRRVADPAILDALKRAQRPYKYPMLFWARAKWPVVRAGFRHLAAILKRTASNGGPYTR
jgi:glycosyltransferase involved in cell wall biosynthesis